MRYKKEPSLWLDGVDCTNLSQFDKRHPRNNPEHILSTGEHAKHLKWYAANKQKIAEEHKQQMAEIKRTLPKRDEKFCAMIGI